MKKLLVLSAALLMSMSLIAGGKAGKFPQAGAGNTPIVTDAGQLVVTEDGEKTTDFITWDDDAFTLYAVDGASDTAAKYYFYESSTQFILTTAELGARTTTFLYSRAEADTVGDMVDFINDYEFVGLQVYYVAAGTETAATVAVSASSIAFITAGGLYPGTTEYITTGMTLATLEAIVESQDGSTTAGLQGTWVITDYGTGDAATLFMTDTRTLPLNAFNALYPARIPLDKYESAGSGWVATLLEGTYPGQDTDDIGLTNVYQSDLDCLGTAAAGTVNISTTAVHYMYLEIPAAGVGVKNVLTGFRLKIDVASGTQVLNIQEADTDICPDFTITDNTELVLPAGTFIIGSSNTIMQLLIAASGTSTSGYLQYSGYTAK